MDTDIYEYDDYEWFDLLTEYNNVTFAYDIIGNPLTYNNGNAYSFTWQNGRQLAAATVNSTNISYEYNIDGLRTKKAVQNGNTYLYYYSGDKLISMTWENGAKSLNFLYKGSSPYSVVYRYSENSVNYSTSYYYITNLQGDVVAIMNAEHGIVAEYVYDAWGNILAITNSSGVDISGNSIHIANLNPIRYRGYFYDTETGFYYLQSRYYDPVVGRFISMDKHVISGESIQGYNLYTYSFNNTVNLIDDNGMAPKRFDIKNAWKQLKQGVKNIVEDIKEDVRNFEWDNQSEDRVLESNYFSIYKGVPVIRINGDRSASFGAIFLTRETNDRDHPEDVVRHEYGHTKQLNQLGVMDYALCIGLPSMQQWGTGEYYSKPWEITADIYGGVQSRNHNSEDIEAGFKYLNRSRMIGPFVWLFIE